VFNQSQLMLQTYSKNKASPYNVSNFTLDQMVSIVEEKLKNICKIFPKNMKRYISAKPVLEGLNESQALSSDDEIRIGFHLLAIRCKNKLEDFFNLNVSFTNIFFVNHVM